MATVLSFDFLFGNMYFLVKVKTMEDSKYQAAVSITDIVYALAWCTSCGTDSGLLSLYLGKHND